MEKKDNTLPQKENALFKQIVKFYETKQYKKGLKASEQILKKFPQHGETLAMKGLTINCMSADKKEEAYALVKEGIKYDMKSHVCWHVYGLLYRSDRDYKQAIKCYGQALKMDKENLQILRDLSLLQIHTRDLKGYLKTRYELLQLKPVHRTNWVAYAVANHLLNKNGTACKVIEAYQKLDEQDPKYETSEMIMYKNMIIEQMGKIDDALAHLDANWDEIVDKLGARKKRASFLLQLGREEEAQEAYMSLIQTNVENLEYHEGLRRAHGLLSDEAEATEEQQEKLVELYTQLCAAHPRANAPRRVPLDFCTGEKFVQAADSYIRRKLRSGIPSLYSDLLPLYKNPEKVAALEQLEEQMLASLEATQKFPPSAEEPEPQEETPMVIMWTWKLLANHFERTGQPTRALEMINKAIDHTPSCVELYLCKGRIYKHHGNTKAASACMEKARSMDLADRYLNTRCTVYFLRDGQIDKAEKTVVLFTKEGDQVNNLHEMQCMWWEIECGKAHLKNKNYGPALKKLTSVEKHFTDFSEDQFDFHSYCLRKMTLRSYYAMLQNADTIRTNKNFVKAAEAVITCYLALHACPMAAEVDEFSGMDEKEKKKAKAKKAKAEARAKEEAAKAEKAAKGGGKKGKKGAAPPAQDSKSDKKKKDEDDDPMGAKLLQKNPLDECLRYVNLLQKFQPNILTTHILAYDVYKQMERPLAMVKALRSAACIDASAPELHPRMCDFFHGVESGAIKLSPIAQEVVAELTGDEQLLGGKSVQDYNSEYVAASGDFAPARIAGAQGKLARGAAGVDVLAPLTDLSGNGLTISLCEEVLAMVEGFDPAEAGKYKELCAAKFPLSTFFNPHLLEQEQLFAPELQYRDKEVEG
jgi:peptide alpha-N-acetyltransferase